MKLYILELARVFLRVVEWSLGVKGPCTKRHYVLSCHYLIRSNNQSLHGTCEKEKSLLNSLIIIIRHFITPFYYFNLHVIKRVGSIRIKSGNLHIIF